MNDAESLQLLARWQEGDADAAAKIFDRYVERLIIMTRQRLSPKMQRRVDAEDVVQSVYRSFFREAAKDDRYVLKRSGDLWKLLAGIAIKKLKGQIEFHSAKKRAVADEGSIMLPGGSLCFQPTAVAGEPTADEAVALAEELQHVTEQLEPLHQQILELRLQGAAVDEIAVEVDRSERTVRRVLNNVTNELRRRLEDDEDG
jgi:RNA polymerase sigma-70 factor (ECF subfamily)